MKIIAYKNPSPKGITLEFDMPWNPHEDKIKHDGAGIQCKEWWFSWERLSEYFK